MEKEIQKFDTIVTIVNTNKPVIAEKIGKALDAAKLIVKVETDQDDELANNFLVKCNATLPVVEGLRKEYTSIIDQWKKGEMELESALKKEMERIRDLRNDRANRIAQDNREKQAGIEKEKNKAKEIARIKSEQVVCVEVGVAQRIAQGEQSIATMFDKLTLETIDEAAKKLEFKPNLKEDLFRGFLIVDYNHDLVSEEEFKGIVEKAFVHFDYPKCNKLYIEAVLKVVEKWKGLLPPKKAELMKLQSAGEDEGRRLLQESKEKASKFAQVQSESLAKQEAAIKAKAQEELGKQTLDAEFRSQIQSQEIALQDNVRGAVSYRLANEEELIKSPIKIVEIMGRIMVNVLADPNFKGIYKRDRGGFPKRDEKGNAVYIDEITGWLDLLAKIKPAPDFDGVQRFEDVSTIAKTK